MTAVANRSQRPLSIDLRPAMLVARRRIRQSRIAQICLILALWWASAGIVRLLSLPVPSGMLGLALVLILLATRRISLFTLRRGTECSSSYLPWSRFSTIPNSSDVPVLSCWR
jgi:hypothetical protein